jgi:hypothetical protein
MASEPGTEVIGERAWARDFDKPKTINDRRARRNAARSELPAPFGDEGEIKWTGTTTSSMVRPRLVCQVEGCSNREPLFLTTGDDGKERCERCAGSDLIRRSEVTTCKYCGHEI